MNLIKKKRNAFGYAKTSGQADKNTLMGLEHPAPNKNYQKGEVLEFFGLSNDQEFLNSNQPVSGMIFIKKTKRNVNIIKEWLDIFYNNFDFVNDEEPKIKTKDYIRNLHDQSIWSILNAKYKCKNFPLDYYTDRFNKAILYNRNNTYFSNDINKNILFNKIIRHTDIDNVHIENFLNRFFVLQKQISEKDNLINSLNQEKQKLEQDKNQQIQALTNEKNSLQNEKSSLQTQISKLQNSLNSIPTKKTNLEVLNLEQDLKIKELQVLKIQKELEQELKNKKLEELKLKKELGEKFIQNITLNLINANSAKARIQNHLAYKLGTALIINSKSIFGYIKMPYILMAITIAHKEQNKNLKLIKDKLLPLESYTDYQEALKEKECFTYKLGEAFIKAHKNWYGGGGI